MEHGLSPVSSIPLGLVNPSARSPDGSSRDGIRGLEFRCTLPPRYRSLSWVCYAQGLARMGGCTEISRWSLRAGSVTSRAPRLMTICHIVSIGCPDQCGITVDTERAKLMKDRQCSRTKSFVCLGSGVLHPRAAVVMNSRHENTKREATWDYMTGLPVERRPSGRGLHGVQGEGIASKAESCLRVKSISPKHEIEILRAHSRVI